MARVSRRIARDARRMRREQVYPGVILDPDRQSRSATHALDLVFVSYVNFLLFRYLFNPWALTFTTIS